jgi:predicted AlkP superfamily pyrophosphatase or phosphodiesterase
MKPVCAVVLLAFSANSFSQLPKLGLKPPKLVLLISIDQFRADYTERFAPYYLPAKTGSRLGGFRFLMETGARYLDAHHNHIPTATGPGHATLLTGSEPAIDGIIGNDWFDRTENKPMYCVDDPSVHPVGGSGKPMSPRNLKVTTVGDELKMATGGRAKVVGISFKDRAAILMAGHAADTVIWFDGTTGNWVSSSFYAPSGHLPAWVTKINEDRLVDNAKGQNWDPLLENGAYALTRRNPGEPQSSGTRPFSHRLGSDGPADPAYFAALTSSGQGQEFVFKTVERAIDGEKLGQHDVPDLFVLNLATNDYIGHRYGPNSPEVMDISVRTDRLLSELFNSLNRSIGIDNVAIVVTADHGILPVPEESGGVYRTGSARVPSSPAVHVEQALSKQFGSGRWLLGGGLYEQNLYLDHSTIREKGLKIEDVEHAAANAAMDADGVFAAFTRTQILSNGLPQWDWTKLVLNGYHPRLGGDVLILEATGVLFGSGTGTNHGSAWAYDSHVPLLLRGPGIGKGVFGRRVHTADIASTLCHILGIEYPTGNVGEPLFEAIAH